MMDQSRSGEGILLQMGDWGQKCAPIPVNSPCQFSGLFRKENGHGELGEIGLCGNLIALLTYKQMSDNTSHLVCLFHSSRIDTMSVGILKCSTGVSLQCEMHVRSINNREGRLTCVGNEKNIESGIFDSCGGAPVMIVYEDGVAKPAPIPTASHWSILNHLPAILRKNNVQNVVISPETRRELEKRIFTEEQLAKSDSMDALTRRTKIGVAVMQLYMASGAALHRIDSSFEALLQSIGLPGSSVYLVWNGFIVSLRQPKTGQHLDTDIFISPFALNLGRLSAVTRLVMDLPVLTILEAENRVKAIATRNTLYPDWLKHFVCIPVVAFTFAPMLYNGDWTSAALALPLSFVTGSLFAVTPHTNPVFSDLIEFVGGFLNGFFGRIILAYAGNQCYLSSVLASIVWLIPGVPLTMGVIQIVSKDTSNGVARIAAAFLTLILLGFGMSLGSYLGELVPFVYNFVTQSNAQNLKCVAINPLWDFLLFPLSAVAIAILLDAEYWQWILIIPPAGLSFGAWWAFQQPPYDVPFIIVVLFAAFISGLCGFGYARLTQDSAFPIIYTAFKYIVPGGLALKSILAGFPAENSIPASGLVVKVFQALLGCLIGTYFAQIFIWPSKTRHWFMYR
jgi:uncharacterized membrane protein YjjP (DUF1212 family)